MLLTSVNAKDGKSALLQVFRDECGAFEPRRLALVEGKHLAQVSPADFHDYQLVIVDGPSVSDSDALMDISREWRTAFQGCLLVCVKRATQRAALVEADDWMRSQSLPVLGVIWNEYLCPPRFVFLRQLRERFFGRAT